MLEFVHGALTQYTENLQLHSVLLETGCCCENDVTCY